MTFEKAALKSAAAGITTAAMVSVNSQPDAVQKGFLAAACLGSVEFLPVEKIPILNANKAIADVFVATILYCCIEPIAIGSGQAMLPQFLTMFASFTLASYGTDVVFSAEKAAKRVINVQ